MDISAMMNALGNGKKPNIGPKQAKKQLKEFKKQFGMTRETFSVVLIGQNRKIRTRKVSNPRELFQGNNVSEFSLDRLGENIHVWYDPDAKGTNRRLTSIMGHETSGQAVFGRKIDNKLTNLSAEEFIEMENKLYSEEL